MDRVHMRTGNGCKTFRLKLKFLLNFAERIIVKWVVWTGWRWIGRRISNTEHVVQLAKQDVGYELTDFRGVWHCKWPVGCEPSKSHVAHGQRGSHVVTWTGWRLPPLYRNSFINWKYWIQETLVHTARCTKYLFRSLYPTCLYPTIQCTFLTPTFPIPPHRLVPCRAFPFWTNQARVREVGGAMLCNRV